MDELSRATRLTGQEPALQEYLRHLDGFQEGRRAVHVRFSRLRPYHRLAHQLRVSTNLLDALARKYESNLFRLHDGDIMLVVKGATTSDIDGAITPVRGLFGDDPAVDAPDGEPDALIAVYDLEHEYDRLRQVCQDLEDARRRAATPAPHGHGTMANAGGSRPIGVGDLLQVERAIREADLTVVMRHQPVVFSSPSKQPVPLFQELYISSVDLSRIALPGCNLTADRWLFQHLTEILDQRMLALLMRRQEPALDKDFSLNLNVATVLSPEFLKFDREVVAVGTGKVIVELQQIDIFADPERFMVAREFLHERGYRICLDGVKHVALPLVDRQRLGVDFVKLQWDARLIDEQAGAHGADLREAVARAGQDHLILCRCDSPKALQVGRALGISLYQGRYFDHFLRKAQSSTAPLHAASV